jgi:hypothetical protein
MKRYRRAPDVPTRQRINRLAHFEAAQHEQRVKAGLLALVQDALDAGASIDQVAELVDTRERAARQSESLPA